LRIGQEAIDRFNKSISRHPLAVEAAAPGGHLKREPQGIAEDARADLPALSESAKRKLAVQWDTIRDKQKLTDQDLVGYDLGRQWLLGMLPKSRQGMNLGGLNIGHTFEDRTRAAGWLGLDLSVKAAEGRFGATDGEYWWRWCCMGAPYESYADWLETFKRETVAELKAIWAGRSAASDKWFEATCKPAIEKGRAFGCMPACW